MSTQGSPGASQADAERNRVFGAGLIDDPYPTYHRLREEAPVRPGTLEGQFPELELMSASSMWGDDQLTVLSYEGCNDVLRRHRPFSSHWYDRTLTLVVGPKFSAWTSPCGADHRRPAAQSTP